MLVTGHFGVLLDSEIPGIPMKTKRFIFVWRVFFAQYRHVVPQTEDEHSFLHGIFRQEDCRPQSVRLPLRPIRNLFARLAGTAVIAQGSALHSIGVREQSVENLVCNLVSYGEIPASTEPGQIIQPLFDQDSPTIQMIQEGVAVHVQNRNQGFLWGCQSQYTSVLGKILKIYL